MRCPGELEIKWQDANPQLGDDVFNNRLDYVNGGVFDFMDRIPRKQIYEIILIGTSSDLAEIERRVEFIMDRYVR